MKTGLADRIFNIKDQDTLRATVLEIFRYQTASNKIYREFLAGIHVIPDEVIRIEDIPFLPTEFFKFHKIISGNHSPHKIFESSGTTGNSVSRHYVADIGIYKKSFFKAFRIFYGEPSEYIFAALLPSYTERANSSLVYMTDHLIAESRTPFSGFYINNTDEMLSMIAKCKKDKQKVILMGVSFALLDLAEKYSPDLSDVIVMETGGMKGRRKEITREELHSVLKEKFNVSEIHSEYGMTELLSQAYSKGNGIFRCPPWMKILIRDPRDPLSLLHETGKTGCINIIDLANIYSCSFIATGDLGKLHDNDTFEILGRYDSSDIRGCNLLVE